MADIGRDALPIVLVSATGSMLCDAVFIYFVNGPDPLGPTSGLSGFEKTTVIKIHPPLYKLKLGV